MLLWKHKNGQRCGKYEIFNHSDQLISPTEFQRNTAPDYIKKNIAVIHDGIDTELIKPKADMTNKLHPIKFIFLLFIFFN